MRLWTGKNDARIVLKQNYFNFNGKFYLQTERLTMGSPLSGLLANIFMNHFERKCIMFNKVYKNKILYYGRYVDDTFILFNGTHRQIEAMMSDLNKQHPWIRLTMEFEEEKNINLLNVTVERKNEVLCYSIYRKPTVTSTTIHNSSFLPHSHKMAACNSFVHRAVSFPLSDDDRKNEIDIIKHIIAVINGYHSSIVDKLLQRPHERSLLSVHQRRRKSIQHMTITTSLLVLWLTFLRRTTQSQTGV